MIPDVTIRTDMIEGDIGEIVRYHDEYYSGKYGFNHDFGRYVESPLTEFFKRRSSVEHIWLLDVTDAVKGCVALVQNTPVEAQLRWFFVDESLRGRGYGQMLITRLIDFAPGCGYQRIILWTVSLLTEARIVYEKNGFLLLEEKHSNLWGRELVEQKFSKIL